MAYEVFTRNVVRSGVPLARITNFGRISLNIHATEILKENTAEYVILLYDKDALKMAIKPASKTDTRAYRLLFTRKGVSCSLSAKTFFDFIKYDFQSRTYSAEWNAKEKMFEIQMTTDGLHSRQKALRETRGAKGRIGRKDINETAATAT